MQIILLIGAKFQVIITKMGISILERGGIIRGTPVVQPGDDLFWFSRPRLILFLIHFVLFQVIFFLRRKRLANTELNSSLWSYVMNHVSANLIDFISAFLMQNAFQIAFFAWSWVSNIAIYISHISVFSRKYVLLPICKILKAPSRIPQYEFGFPSCYHENFEEMIIRIIMG